MTQTKGVLSFPERRNASIGVLTIPPLRQVTKRIGGQFSAEYVTRSGSNSTSSFQSEKDERENKRPWYAAAGAVALILYGVIPTLQPANFGRVYAAYGGVFVIMSILWGWRIDKIVPDRFDVVGGAIALTGVFIIMYWPRS